MALWDRRVFPRPLLLDVWSVDQELSASGELDRNADAKPSSRPTESDSACSQVSR